MYVVATILVYSGKLTTQVASKTATAGHGCGRYECQVVSGKPRFSTTKKNEKLL